MFDTISEKAAILYKMGSFWYKILENDASYTPNKLAHIPFLSNVIQMMRNITGLALSDAVIYTGETVLRFTDKDISDTTLLIPDNMVVVSIVVNDTIWTKDAQFKSGYGFLEFDKDPRAIFSNMRVHVKQALKRTPNILNYPLGTWGVCGDVSQIIQYYRNNQSVSQFYKASAQACGLIVVQDDDIIQKVIQLADDKIVYITEKGKRYDAWYPHTILSIGSFVRKGQVIGAEHYELFTKYEDIQDIESVSMLHTCPIPGLRIQNTDGITLYRDGVFKPDYAGDNIQLYWDYLDSVGAAAQPLDQPSIGNPLKHFMQHIANGRVMVIRIKDTLPKVMAKKLLRFILDNSPIGSVLLLA